MEILKEGIPKIKQIYIFQHVFKLLVQNKGIIQFLSSFGDTDEKRAKNTAHLSLSPLKIKENKHVSARIMNVYLSIYMRKVLSR